MWKWYAFLSALFAALTAILAKVGAKGTGGNVATVIRTGVVLLLAWGIVLFSGQMKEVKELGKTNLSFLFLSGLATGFSWIFYFRALETGDVSKVAPVGELSVVFVLILSFIFPHETPALKTIPGVLLVLTGAIVLVLYTWKHDFFFNKNYALK
ncbi:MAG: EamA family transporter [Tannerellaceae bacterium]|jgi:transporter family protein|nr:EamA family transporter [Tannerellaceae bacterium]